MTGSLQDQLVLGVRNKVAVTLQTVIAKIGPLPNECGSQIKEILNRKDFTTLARLGVAVESCLQERSWKGLKKSLEEIRA